jgi:phosphate acyltransferase
VLPIIGVDLLGSDAPSRELVDTLALFLEQYPSRASFVAFGSPDSFLGLKSSDLLQCVETDEEIHMADDPLKAVRKKKRASMTLGMEMLKEKKIDALISCGNTGALLALSTLKLRPLPNISRPALVASLPTQQDEVAVVDVGANINSSADLLVEFASIGTAYKQCMGVQSPRVALLNIGTEPIKGTKILREAYERLTLTNDKTFTFVGNIEPRDVFKGKVDVIVTDGFSGNIFLKTAEGIGEMLLFDIEQQKATHHPCFEHLCKKLSYSKYPGALLAGCHGLVIKCHGTAKPSALVNSILKAIQLYNENFLDKLEASLKK